MGTSKQVLHNCQKREGFKEIIEEAKLIVENSYELSLRRHGKSGDIFALKNFGWPDKHDHDHTHKSDPLEQLIDEIRNSEASDHAHCQA